jgi:biopolymer transport protein ExbB
MFQLLQAAGATDAATTTTDAAAVAATDAAAATTDAAAAGADAAATAAADAAAAAAPVLTDAQKAAAAEEAAKAAGVSGEELTVWGMVMHADWVGRIVLLILVLCSIYALALLFEKIFVMRSNKKKITEFVAAFRKAKSPEEAADLARKQPDSFIKKMFVAGMDELNKSKELGLYFNRDARDHTLDRVRAAMTIEQNKGVEQLGSNMTFLASIGSNAPFIGLFGTVWGIMRSFIGIANTQTTSLAVVAPGIAEALLATAVGLAAAIPAVLIYNFSAKQIGTMGGYMDDFQAEFMSLISRDMDRKVA